jgi:cold shock CspA family protein
MAETWNKKELQKKKQKKKKDKEERKEQRKADAKQGSGADFLLAYVDEDGNLSETPPDPLKKVKISEEDIEIKVAKNRAPSNDESVRKGTVTFFNEAKGYGFIKDQKTLESIFVHSNGLLEPIKDKNQVTFKVEKGPKGLTAIAVKVLR